MEPVKAAKSHDETFCRPYRPKGRHGRDDDAPSRFYSAMGMSIEDAHAQVLMVSRGKQNTVATVGARVGEASCSLQGRRSHWHVQVGQRPGVTVIVRMQVCDAVEYGVRPVCAATAAACRKSGEFVSQRNHETFCVSQIQRRLSHLTRPDESDDRAGGDWDRHGSR